jgi:peptidase M48-like protein
MTIERNFISVLSLLLIAALAPTLNAQQQTCLPAIPIPANSQPNLFTGEKEVFLGDAVAEHLQKYYRVIEDPDVTGYLTKIGEKLAKHVPLTQVRFQFFLVDLPDANAFVFPGGRIYVSRKLVAQAQTEDELAAVIAHEMGHLVVHESAVDMTRRLREVLGITEVGDRRDVFLKYNQLLESSGRKPEASKRTDRETGQLIADQIGMYALVSAGYDATASATMWDRSTETKGKTGSWFSDLFGKTRPEQKRLREMLNVIRALPRECLAQLRTVASEEFKIWQSAVVNYTGLGRRESLHNVVSKLQLNPALRTDITHIKFSPDGKYVLAQDDSGINVLTRDPFTPVFRIEAPDAKFAKFSSDSQSIVFSTDNLRVERWSIADEKLIDAREVVLLKGCLQTSLASTGSLVACLTPNYDLLVLDSATSQPIITRKGFFRPTAYHITLMLEALANRRYENGDVGIPLINMGFSPDGRYLVAAYLGVRPVGGGDLNVVEGFDLTTGQKVSFPDSIDRLVVGGFSFMGNDRLVGINPHDYQKSAIVSFPDGKTITQLPLRGNITAATRGPYVLIRPVKDYPVGVMDINTKIIFKSNKQSALDIYDDVFVAERRNGELGLYRVQKNEFIASTLVANVTLGRLTAVEISDDSKWLALSARSRGGVWNLEKGEATLYLRGFRGSYISSLDRLLFADFPRFDAGNGQVAERNIVRFNLMTGDVQPGTKIQGAAHQAGKYLIVMKREKPDSDEKQVDRDRLLEVLDARTMAVVWTRTYPDEPPVMLFSQQHDTGAFVWYAGSEEAKRQIKSDPQLTEQLNKRQGSPGDYFVEVVDVRNGKTVGRVVIDTGKDSFRLASIYAAGEWMVAMDSTNRVLIYSLKNGNLLGRFFGGVAAISPSTGMLCVQNEIGKLGLYDLNSMEKRDEFVFSNSISFLRFTPDGKRLIVLTSNQYAYTIDVSAKAQTVANN